MNNFNLLRLLAAIAVLVSHAWPLALGTGTPEPLQALTGYKLGSTAVSVFFAVSGYFITKSFVRRSSLPDFLLARVARIYPALLVVLLLTVMVLGPLATGLPFRAFLADRQSWTYLPRNLLLRHPQWALPGVFASNPGGPAINGSLWTLFFEVACYAGIVAFGTLGLLRRWAVLPIIAGAVAVSVLVPQREDGGALAMTGMLFLPFALGAGAYVHRARVPVSGGIALGLFAMAALVGVGSPLYPLCRAAALSYGALWFGYALPWLRGYARLGDYSYGVYIYAFPIEQIIAWLAPGCGPARMIAVALPVTVAAAVLSWHFVEHPALVRRHVLRRWRGVTAP